jgi:hypothetical protein
MAIASRDGEKCCEQRHILRKVAARLRQQGLKLIEFGLGVVVPLDAGSTVKLADEGIERTALMMGGAEIT